MAQETAIGWTDLSWNPTHGCSIVSRECTNCYAAALSNRYGQTPLPWTPANAAENVLLKPHKLREPLSNAKAWRGLGAAAALAGKTDGKLVFVDSMSDLFHEQIPDAYVARVFAVMSVAQRHTFQVLTKRPDRMQALLTESSFWGAVARERIELVDAVSEDVEAGILPNVWLGVSIGLRQFVGRADLLRQTPAAVRFVSAEPLLGPLVPPWTDGHWTPRADGSHDPYEGPELDLAGIDWLIVGGESGPGHAPMDVQWARDLRGACLKRSTALFFKQWGGVRPTSGGRELDGRTWDEFPGVGLSALRPQPSSP